MKNVMVFMFLAFVSVFFFTACGGEDRTGSECDPIDDTATTDDTATDDVQPDDVQTDNILMDEENPDEDQVVTDFCKKMLDIAGDWYKVEGGDKITMTLVSQENTCEVTMTWQQGWTTVWHGLELPLEKVYDSETESYYALKKSGENLVREDTLKDGSLSQEIVFAR